jgi:tripartite-type tricarboxylate transporter receptor subunit TctC
MEKPLFVSRATRPACTGLAGLRVVLSLATLSLAAVALPVAAQSGSYPARPVRLIVPYPPGGAIDPIARMIVQRLDSRWGQPVVVDNKAGAGTIIGTDAVAKAAPDGYTLGLVATSFTVLPALHASLPFDPVRDFAPIGLVARIPLLLVVNPQLPVQSVADLIALAKARPGELHFSSLGNGTIQHLANELFKSMAGVDITHVPYKGSGPSTMSVVSGETSMTIDTVYLMGPLIKAGRLRALASAGAQRSTLAPDTPTLAEAGLPGYAVSTWVGLLAPAGTPAEVIRKWNQHLEQMLANPEVRAQQVSQGMQPSGSTPEQFGELIRSEVSRWARVARQAGLSPE